MITYTILLLLFFFFYYDTKEHYLTDIWHFKFHLKIIAEIKRNARIL